MTLTDVELSELASTRTDLIEFQVGDIAECGICQYPSVIYTAIGNTEFTYGDSTYSEMCLTPACARCLTEDIAKYLRYIDHSHSLYERLYVSQFKLMSKAQEDMKSLQLCAVCLSPEVPTSHRWSFMQVAVANPVESEPNVMLNVHNYCSETTGVLNCAGSCDTHIVRDTRANYAMTRFYNISSYNLFEYPSYLEVDNDFFCEPCFEYARTHTDIYLCTQCEGYTYDCNRFDSDYYCDSCYNNNIFSCDDCGEEYHQDNGHYCEREDEDYEDHSLIHSYGYKPSTEFFGQGQWFLGFELEVESYNGGSKHDGAQIAQDVLGGRAYMKEDGSLNDGFEIVTHPHTLEAYNKDLDWSFLSKLQVNGFRSWNTGTCGLHVHVSRTAFDPYGIRTRSEKILLRQAHELRFMKLIYDNQRQVERIAGRSGNHYSTFGDRGNLVPKVKYGHQNDGRYSAVNTENYATLEVRVFRGSLKEKRVRSALEFVHAAVEYTRDLKVNGKNNALMWSKFIAFVVTNETTYPNLFAVINQTFGNERVQD